MRADRLLSLLLLLQARGRMTAPELARELEVSERTIYRDIDALCAAGVPVYGEAGPRGGYALVDSYRTQLTGLTRAEARALFMLGIPEPLADLGVGQDLRSALRKLDAALPASQSQDRDRVRQRFYLDASGWERGQESAPSLQAIQQAVAQDRRLLITYRLPAGGAAELLVDPYGLVAKAGVWYVVYARRGGVQARRVAALLDAQLSDERFERPDGFDLERFWQRWCAEHEQRRTLYRATVRVAPSFRPALPWHFGERVRQQVAQAAPDAEGWLTLELAFESFEAARASILACGRGVEVLEPQALRRSVLDYAEQIIARYAQ